MIRIATAAVCLGLLGSVAFAQSARDPDPLALPGNGSGDEITVPGTIERPVQLPDGDVRSARQRARDRSKFDRCVMKLQDRDSDSPSANPVSIAPEEYCASRLGMRDRNSIPDSKSRNR
jgi:hypothetical protein